MFRRGILCLALAGLFVGTGCFGNFGLTRDVYGFNKDVHPNRWARWGTFLGLNVIPVYPAAFVIDTVFTNSAEFWTGRNPLEAPDTAQNLPAAGGQTASLTPTGEGSWSVVVIDAQNHRQELRMVQEPDGIAVYDASGALIGRGVAAGGPGAPVAENTP